MLYNGVGTYNNNCSLTFIYIVELLIIIIIRNNGVMHLNVTK